MRLFRSPRWTQCLQISRSALVVFLTLGPFQLLSQAQGKERPVNGYGRVFRTLTAEGR